MTDNTITIDSEHVGKAISVRFPYGNPLAGAQDDLEQMAVIMYDQFRHPVLVTPDPENKGRVAVLGKDNSVLTRPDEKTPYQGVEITLFYKHGCKGYELGIKALENIL